MAEFKDIIFAKTYKFSQGTCIVTFGDMKEDMLFFGINKLFSMVKDDPSSPYHMIGRSSFVKEDSIVRICPCKKILTIAGDSLLSPHREIAKEINCSEDLLRQLRAELNTKK